MDLLVSIGAIVIAFAMAVVVGLTLVAIGVIFCAFVEMIFLLCIITYGMISYTIAKRKHERGETDEPL